MNTARTLDHIGIAGPDLAMLAAQWEKLGFTLTPLARHSGRRTPDGPIVPFGTGNRCIMLERGYLELIAIVDPGAFSNTLDRFLARYAGAHILALDVADEDANLRRLRAAGFDIPGIAYLERPVDDADPTGPKARFARLPLPEAPEGRIQLIRHLTREAIWQPRFMAHRNGAATLEAVLLAVENPAAVAARFSRLSGVPVTPDRAGGFALSLPQGGTVRLLSADAFAAVLPGAHIPCLPFIGALVIGTADKASRAAQILHDNKIPCRTIAAGLLVEAEHAGGVSLVFRAD